MSIVQIKKVLSSFRKVILLIVRLLFFMIPFMVALHVAYAYTMSILFGHLSNISSEQYKILFGAIGITATLSALSFRASTSTEEKDKKSTFYYAGERLFHSTILFMLATVMTYFLAKLEVYKEGVYGLDRYLRTPIKLAVAIPCILFFCFGLIYCSQSLSKLHKTLFKGHELF